MCFTALPFSCRLRTFKSMPLRENFSGHDVAQPHGPGKLALVALIVYSAVMVSLTMLKAFYRIGYLWDPAAHRNRSVELVPFNEVMSNSNWFIPVFGYGGNIAFFVPFGMLAYVWFHQSRGAGTRMVLWSTLTGFLVSLAIEVSQFLFSLGYSDIDDLLMNTLGAFVGALFAKMLGPRFFRLWVWLAILLGLVFAVLVGLGERLGDPDKIVKNT